MRVFTGLRWVDMPDEDSTPCNSNYVPPQPVDAVSIQIERELLYWVRQNLGHEKKQRKPTI